MVFSRGYKEKVIETVNPFVSPFYCFYYYWLKVLRLVVYVLLGCYCILVIPYSHDRHDGSENVPPLENKIS